MCLSTCTRVLFSYETERKILLLRELLKEVVLVK